MSVFGEPVTRADVAYIVKGTVLVMFSLLTIWFSSWQWQKASEDFRAWWNRPVVQQGYPEPTIEELRAAMRFHGIFVAEQDENREWYFVRAGKNINLFAYQKREK